MKIAVLIQCHKDPEQVNMMIRAMRHSAFSFYIHVDRKSGIGPLLETGDQVFLLPEEERVDVRWSRFSIVESSLKLFRFAAAHGEYDYFWLCSGQDFPIKSPEQMLSLFEAGGESVYADLTPSKNTGAGENNYDKRTAVYFPEWMLDKSLWKRVLKRAYVELTGGYRHTFSWARRHAACDLRFYYGSAWVCLSKNCLAWIFEYLERHPEYSAFLKNSNCSDETFFQTLIMNSPFASCRRDGLHYTKRPKNSNSPKILRIEDLDSLLDSPRLMARKFDRFVDGEILKELKRRVSL